MKTRISILLLALGILAGCQQPEQSTESIKNGTIKITIMYPNGTDKNFDMDYYKKKHMPMLDELFGDAMIKYEIDQGIGGRTPEDDMPFLAIGYLYFETLEAYQGAFGPNAEQILSDIPNYTNIQPTVQISQVVN